MQDIKKRIFKRRAIHRTSHISRLIVERRSET